MFLNLINHSNFIESKNIGGVGGGASSNYFGGSGSVGAGKESGFGAGVGVGGSFRGLSDTFDSSNLLMGSGGSKKNKNTDLGYGLSAKGLLEPPSSYLGPSSSTGA